ncbi:MAG: hypothetical protein J6C76_00650 [Oscillospiraceae bacterium]|nr:hypothetical protein [Oscillospiraceae bacterium]
MSDKMKTILSETAVFVAAYLLDWIYLLLVVCTTPDFKKHWNKGDYWSSYILFVLITLIYVYILIKYYRHFRRIGLGFIYGVIVEILNVVSNLSMLMRPPYSDTLGGLNIMILIFSFTGLPLLFIIIAIVYFAAKRRTAKHKSGE